MLVCLFIVYGGDQLGTNARLIKVQKIMQGEHRLRMGLVDDKV